MNSNRYQFFFSQVLVIISSDGESIQDNVSGPYLIVFFWSSYSVVYLVLEGATRGPSTDWKHPCGKYILLFLFKVSYHSWQAVFDSCHSCSLLGRFCISFWFTANYIILDLEHFRCNRVYVPWRNKGRRKSDFPRNIMSESRYSLILSDGNDPQLNIQCGIMPVSSILSLLFLLDLSVLLQG